MTQDERIKHLAKQGRCSNEIAHVLGMNVQTVRRKLRKMELLLTAAQPNRNLLPYGLTDASYKLRATLGQIIIDLMEKNNQPAVSSLTGLHRREIYNAMKHPFKHDWTLSQIERTLGCEGKSLNDIM